MKAIEECYGMVNLREKKRNGIHSICARAKKDNNNVEGEIERKIKIKDKILQ